MLGISISVLDLTDGRTLLFLLPLSLCACLLSHLCRWPNPKAKEQLALIIPPAILLCWFALQRELLFVDRMSEFFYRSQSGGIVWRMNSGILIAFGLGFSLRLIRTIRMRAKVYGVLCALGFLPLLIWFNSIDPVQENRSLAYRWEFWRNPPVTEPLFDGKSLSYWASRMDDVADESEPALTAIRAMGPAGLAILIEEFRTGKGGWNFGEERPQAWEVRQHVAEVLMKLGPDARPAVPLMIASLGSSDRNTREQAAEVLGRTGDSSQPAIDALLRALEDEEVAYISMNSLARLGATNIELIHRLAAVAKNAAPKPAYWATVALERIGSPATPVVPDLVEIVRGSSGDQRQPAVQAIALCGTNASSAVPALIVGLQDSQEWTRKCIYIALGRIGPSARDAIPSLQNALTNEPYLPSRTDIARALWRIDPTQFAMVSAAIRKSLDALGQPRQNGRVTYDFLSALDVIGEIGPPAVDFVPTLRDIMRSNNPIIQFNAAWALLRVAPADSESANAVLRRLTGIDEYPLEQIGTDAWGEGLSELKRNRESYHLRLAAAGVLWQNSANSRVALTKLISNLIRDWEFYTSMKSATPEAQAAIPALTAILEDPSQAHVHAAAREALRVISGSACERW